MPCRGRTCKSFSVVLISNLKIRMEYLGGQWWHKPSEIVDLYELEDSLVYRANYRRNPVPKTKTPPKGILYLWKNISFVPLLT